MPRSAHSFFFHQIGRNGSATVNLSFFPLSLSSVCIVLPRAPSPSPGGAGPVWSDARGPAGQMEAAASDVFRNLQRGQCDWLCRVHKRTKGTTRQFITSYITSVMTSMSSALLPSPGEMI